MATRRTSFAWRDSGIENVPEPIAFPQLPELNPNNAGKSRSHKTSLKRPFAQASGEEVNIVNSRVNPLQARDYFRRYFPWKVLERMRALQVAQSPVVVVRSNSVVPTCKQLTQINFGYKRPSPPSCSLKITDKKLSLHTNNNLFAIAKYGRKTTLFSDTNVVGHRVDFLISDCTV